MAARLIRRASRLLAAPVSFQPPPAFLPSECVRKAQLAPPFPCQAVALHTSPLCRLPETLPESRPEVPLTTSMMEEDNEFYTKLRDVATVDELLDIGSDKNLKGNRSVMVLQHITARQTEEKKEKILQDPRMQELLKNINTKIEHIWNIRLIKLLKCLYVLGLKGSDHSLQSAEIEVRWRLRRLNIGCLSYLASFLTPDSASKDTKSLFNDLLKEVGLRWTEIKEVRSVLMLTCKLGPASESLMEKLEDKVLEFADRFTPEESRRLLSHLAAQNRRTVSVLRALSFHLLHHKLQLSQAVVVDLAFAYAKLNFCSPQLLQKMATDILPNLQLLKPSEMALIVRSYSSLRYLCPPLLEAVAQECVRNRESFSNLHLYRILASFARLNFQPSTGEEFFNMIHQWLDCESNAVTWYHQLHSVWSLCVLGQATPAHFERFLVPQFYNQLLADSSAMSQTLCVKLMQINAAATLESPGYRGPQLPTDVLAALQTKTQSKSARPLQVEVRDVLKVIFPTDGTCSFNVNTIYGFHIDGEVVLDSSLQALPIKHFVAPHNLQDGATQPLPEGLRRVVFVARDFSQYLYRGKDLMGQFMMTRRHLQAAGLAMVEVPYYDWADIKSDHQKQNFLKEQLKKVLTAAEDSGL